MEQLLHRRRFIQGLGLSGPALAAFATKAHAQSPGITDVDIVNFALNLEYLEAEFYTYATTGKSIAEMGIGIDGTGASGPTTGGQAVTFTDATLFTSDIAMQIAADERAHVTYLRTALKALGADVAAKPAINLAALGIGFASQTEFLAVARALEDVGVTAYSGAAPLVQNVGVLDAAARILGAENEHAANIRLQIAALEIATAALDGKDILPPPTGSRFFSLDANGLTAARTPGEVLFLVYGNQAGSSAGGFFPNGMNGNIKQSTAKAA